MKHTLVFAITLLVLFACSKQEKHAGSASVTTNGTVSGKITDSSGTAKPNVATMLIESNFDPNVDGSTALHSTLTDAEGNYIFEDVPEGHYRLVVRDSENDMAATVEEITVKDGEDFVLPAVPLSQFGSIGIRASDFTYAAGDRLFLPGTEISLSVTEDMVDDSILVIPQIPAGSYSQVFYVVNGSSESMPLISRPVVVSAGQQTILVPDYEGITGIPVGFFTVGRTTEMPLGGEGGDTLMVRDTAELRAALGSDSARVIRIQGYFQGVGQILRIGSHKTLLGMGDSTVLDSIGFAIVEQSDVVIRNLTFTNSADDAISIEKSTYVWVDHNTFGRCADGMVDIKRASDWVTVSWNHFHNQKLVSTIGHSDDNGEQDSTHLHVTFHHNFFETIESAAPRVRYGTVHLYNNVYDSVYSYAIASTQFAQVVVEANVFVKTKEATRIKHTSPYAGELTAAGNILEKSGELLTQGITYDPASFYVYTAQNASGVRIAVTNAAGVGNIATLR